MQTPGFGTPCIPKHPPQGSGRGGALPAPSPAAPLLPLSRFIYTSYLNNSHCLLFSVNVPPKRPTMSYCSHQMGSRMQQVGQMAKRPVWGCWLRQGLPFSSRYLIIILHRALCSLGVGSKWGAGKACTHTTRGLRAHKLPAPPPTPTPGHPRYSGLLLCVFFFSMTTAKVSQSILASCVQKGASLCKFHLSSVKSEEKRIQGKWYQKRQEDYGEDGRGDRIFTNILQTPQMKRKHRWDDSAPDCKALT